MPKPSDSFEPIDGDLLFQDLAGPRGAAVARVRSGYDGLRVSHVGVAVRTGGGCRVLEAYPPAVRLTDLDDYLRRARDVRGRPRVFVGRLRPPLRGLIGAALREGLALCGRPYDPVFSRDAESYYCSELLVEIFRRANGGRPVFAEHPMTFADPRSGEMLPYWRRHYERLGRPVPEGELGSNPGGLSLSPTLEVVHRYGSLTRWP